MPSTSWPSGLRWKWSSSSYQRNSLICHGLAPEISLLSRGATRQSYSSETMVATPMGSHSFSRYLRLSCKSLRSTEPSCQEKDSSRRLVGAGAGNGRLDALRVPGSASREHGAPMGSVSCEGRLLGYLVSPGAQSEACLANARPLLGLAPLPVRHCWPRLEPCRSSSRSSGGAASR